EVSGLKPGAHVKATTVVDGQKVESQDITIEATGIRVMLVAGLPGTAGGKPAGPVSGPPVKGGISFGPESRIVAEFAEDRLNIYYLMDIVNAGTAPVDPGGPVV